MKSNELTFKGKMTQADLNTLFKGLLKSMEEGAIVLENAEKYVALKPAADIEVSVEASNKKDKEKLEITLSWESKPCACKAAGLKISSKEPAAAPKAPAVPVVPAPAAAKPGDKAPEVKKA